MGTVAGLTDPLPWERAIGALAGRRLLFLNWRDPAHPAAGGAECYSWELARRFTTGGAKVVFFTSRPPRLPLRGLVDGVEIVRAGGQHGVYAHAARFMRRFGETFDAIVDFQNGIPFFSPLFLPRQTPVVCLIHHVHQEQFGLYFGSAKSWLGRWLEGPASRRVYRHTPVAVVSGSTRAAVRRELRFRNPIFIVPNGTPCLPATSTVRSVEPVIAVVSRLAVHKRIDLLVRAASELRRCWPSLVLEIAGDGPERARLESLARSLGESDHIRFRGYVSEVEKAEMLDSAWLMVNPSIGEGWGINVMEANSRGVPTVAFDVPGMRDSIIDQVTGWLVPASQPLAAGIDEALRVLADDASATGWAESCRQWAACFNWDDTAGRLARILVAQMSSQASSAEDRRCRSDLVSVVELEVSAETLATIENGLRQTDVLSVRDGVARILIHGSDEQDSRRALARLGFESVNSIAVARHRDLLSLWSVPGSEIKRAPSLHLVPVS